MSNKNIQLKNQDGFTMIEAIVAIFVLTIGLIGTMAAMTYALEFSSISRNVGSAKSVIVASIEEVETLRNAQRLNFRQIANVGKVDNSDASNLFNGFSTGFKQVSLNPGADGVFGTSDDLSANAGADGIYGTADDLIDTTRVRSGYMRQITITDLSDSLKKIEVKVKYLGREGKQGEITGVSYLNDDARVNR
jgi:type II secretory pathway pseudopilin PulG